MFKRQLNSLLMFIWLSTGYGVIHLIVMLWVIVVIQSPFTQNPHYENLQVTGDLEPVISDWDGSLQQWKSRHLDGTPLESERGERQTYLQLKSLTPDVADSRADSWQHRISPLNDYQKPAIFWYFVAPPDYGKNGYFVGFDDSSRQQVGYIDRQGFTSELPTPERSFPVAIHYSYRQNFIGTLAATQLNPDYYNHQAAAEPYWVPEWGTRYTNTSHDAVWLLSGDKIYEIRLSSRSVRTLVENRTDLKYLVTERNHGRGEDTIRLCVRTDSGISFFDPQTGREQKIPVEGDFVSDRVTFASIEPKPDESGTANLVVVVRHHPYKPLDDSQMVRFTVLETNGKIVRDEEIRLAINNQSPGMGLSLSASLCAPLPLAPVGMIAFGPLVEPNAFSKSGTNTTPFQDYVLNLRFYFFSALLVGLTTGWSARRRERDVFGNSSWFWPVLVGAAGWFGWMAYICLRPLPARLPNHSWITSQPEPAVPQGSEVFA